MQTHDLSTLALVSYARDVIEGYIAHKIELGGQFGIWGTALEGNRDVIWKGGVIIRLQAPYVRTEDGLFQLLRVPRLP
jgi:hypothetical protein